MLNELGASLQTIKRRVSGESLDENVLVGESKDTKGLDKGVPLGEDVCCTVETGEGNVIPMNLRFSDDSDEEHRMLKGSSDGSQYGSDSGMGDSLMNTLASECTDGPSKTPTVLRINNVVQKELEVDGVSDSGDTLCDENSPINERDMDGIVMASNHIAQTKPESETGRSNLKRTAPRLEDELPSTRHESSTTVSKTDPSTIVGYGQLVKLDQGSDSLDYFSLPQATLDKDAQSQNNVDMDNFKLKDETNTDPRPFIPAEFLLPKHASTYETPQDKQKASNEQTLLEIRPFDQTPSEITLSEQTSSESSSENNYPQKTRVHDIDEELLLRSLALQNVNTDEGMGEGEGLANGTDYPLVSCAPPPMKTVEEFVEEPDVLFQRLVDIEVMLRPQEKDEDNLKSALLKHVVSIYVEYAVDKS